MVTSGSADREGSRWAGQPQPGEPPRGETSRRLTSRSRTERGVLVPMRDGTVLSVDVIHQDIAGPSPVILIRTPYDKVTMRARYVERWGLEELLQRGYVVALQDLRGRFNSDGEFTPYFNDVDDGYDTVEWIA